MGGMRSLFVALVVLCACKVPPAGPTPEEQAAEEEQKRGDAELTAVADAIDPGPQRPMFEAIPGWLREKIETQLPGEPASEQVVRTAREAIASWDKIKFDDTQAMLVGALVLAKGLILAERAVAAGSDDPELLAALGKAYRLVEQVGFFQNSPLFSQVIGLGVDLAKKDGDLAGQQIEEAMGVLKTAVARAPALHMHTAARLLRENPRHPTVPEALQRLAQAEQSAERFDRAKQLRALVVARKGERATGADWAGLAEACYRALDRGCGEMAKKTARERGSGEDAPDKVAAFDKRLADIETMAGRAAKLEELRAATGLEQRLERGHLLLQIGHQGEAVALFGELRAQHPNDARPVTGLAVATINKTLDFGKAAALVREARKLPGRDKLYYEVALGTVPMLVLSEVITEMAKDADKPPPAMDAAVAELMALIEEFRAFDPARAAVLAVAVEAGKQAAPKFIAKDRAGGMAVVRALPGKAAALAKQFPASKDVWRLVYVTSRVAGTAKEALAMVTLPLPPELEKDPELRLNQARTLLDLAVLWEQPELLEAAGKAAEKLPEGTDADGTKWLRATLDAQAGRLGDKVSLERATAAFTELAGRKSGKEKALALNNLGLLVATAGQAEAAVQHFKDAVAADDEGATPRVNIGAVAFAVGHREDLNELFAAASSAKLATVRVQAYAWLVALADAGAGDRVVTRQEFHANLGKELEGEFRGQLPLGRWGIAPAGEIKMSLGYSSMTGLVLVDEVVASWWLIAPAPTLEGLLAEKAAAPKAGKPVKPKASAK
jgi:tetratricopeptide (TPR) repeat protein